MSQSSFKEINRRRRQTFQTKRTAARENKESTHIASSAVTEAKAEETVTMNRKGTKKCVLRPKRANNSNLMCVRRMN